MKKYIALITIISVLFSGTVFADIGDGTSDNKTTEYSSYEKEAIELLEYLEVLEIEDDGNAEVSRADFAVYVARLLGVDEYAKSVYSKSYFYDLPPEHWATVCVNYLTENGVFSVGDDKLFNPDNAITLTEATKVVLSVLGYRPYAEVKGGYPTGYLFLANQLRIYDNLSHNEKLTKLDAAVLLANTANTVVMDVFPHNDTVEYNKSDKSLLSVYRDIYVIEGRLETVSETSIYPENQLEDAAIIDGIKYEYKGSSALIGQEVRAYYTAPKNGYKEIVLLFSNMDKDDILEISANDFESFDDDYRLTYRKENGKKASVNIARNAVVIYNGICATTGIINLVNSVDEGTICALRSNSGTYDVLVVRHSETFVVGYVDADEQIVYDSIDSNNILDFSEAAGVSKIYDEQGNELAFSAISKNSVLSIFKTNGRIEAWVCTSTIDGVYTEFSNANVKTYLIVDNVEYEVDNKYYPSFKMKLVISQTLTLALNIYGKVCAILNNGDDEGYIFGYYIDQVQNNNGLDNALRIKLYSQSDGLTHYKLANRVRIDGKSYKDNGIKTALDTSLSKTLEIYNAFSDTSAEISSHVIRYKLNDEKEIVEIDTPYQGDNESDNSLRISGVESDADYIYVGIIGRTITFDKNTVLFKVPTDGHLIDADERAFSSSVGLTSSPGNDKPYIAYKTSSDSGAADLIVCGTLVSACVEIPNHIMFDSAVVSLNNVGDDVDVLIGWRDGKKVRYNMAKDYIDDKGNRVKIENADIEKGDLLLLSFDSSGDVNKYCKVYDWRDKITSKANLDINETPDAVFVKDGRDFYGGERMTFGYANKVYSDGTIDLCYTGPGGTVSESYPVTSSIPVTVFDNSGRDGIIYKGTIDDVASYEDVGDNCSAVIVHAQHAVWKTYYVYK